MRLSEEVHPRLGILGLLLLGIHRPRLRFSGSGSSIRILCAGSRVSA